MFSWWSDLCLMESPSWGSCEEFSWRMLFLLFNLGAGGNLSLLCSLQSQQRSWTQFSISLWLACRFGCCCWLGAGSLGCWTQQLNNKTHRPQSAFAMHAHYDTSKDNNKILTTAYLNNRVFYLFRFCWFGTSHLIIKPSMQKMVIILLGFFFCKL